MILSKFAGNKARLNGLSAILKNLKMMIRSVIGVLLFLVITVMATSCSKSSYPSRQQGHPKSCNCPKWTQNPVKANGPAKMIPA